MQTNSRPGHQANKPAQPAGGASASKPKPGHDQDSDRNVDAAFEGKEYGEGNYKAAKQYDDAARDFARSGQVDAAARNAAPGSRQQAEEMAQAEARGKRRSKGEDPALHRPAKKRRGA